jgi:hypothetical protein
VIERALTEHYRCPEQFAKMALAGELTGDAGFFRFGPSVCYGQSAHGTRASRATATLDDVGPGVGLDGGLLRVPFDPTQVADNLRWERYVPAGEGLDAFGQASWRGLYYALRRFLPSAVRRALQRAYLRNWRRRPFPRWPVDDTVDDLLARLLALSLRSQGVARAPFVWFWPEGAASAAIVTHDVETAAGRDRCPWLMDVDDRFRIKSSFQVIPEDRYEVTPAFLDGIRTRGFEINVHDLNHDGRLFADRAEFLQRVERINRYAREFGARGFRSGALYRRPDWYEALDVAYDMSIPNTGHLEIQRGGCCTVMPYFIGDIVELPLTTTQDYSLVHILRDFSSEVWHRQIALVTARHGLLSFIVHPDYLESERARRVYQGLLERLVALREGQGCWVALPGAVEHWWRARSRMSLVRDGERWRVTGPESERARIAWAEVDGDTLSYRVEPAGPVAERAGS